MQAIHVFCFMQTLFDYLEVVAQSRTVSSLMNFMNNVSHPLQGMFAEIKSAFSNRVICPWCNRGCRWRSFLPTAIRLHDSSAVCMKHWLVLTFLPTTVCLYNCFTFALFTTSSILQVNCMMYFGLRCTEVNPSIHSSNLSIYLHGDLPSIWYLTIYQSSDLSNLSNISTYPVFNCQPSNVSKLLTNPVI